MSQEDLNLVELSVALGDAFWALLEEFRAVDEIDHVHGSGAGSELATLACEALPDFIRSLTSSRVASDSRPAMCRVAPSGSSDAVIERHGRRQQPAPRAHSHPSSRRYRRTHRRQHPPFRALQGLWGAHPGLDYGEGTCAS